MLNYTLPREASKAGVTLWHKLKKSGAVRLDQTDWFLPATKANRAVLVELSRVILKYGGEANLLDWVPSDGKSMERIITAFEDARKDDYLELIQHTLELIDELDHEMENENFSSRMLEKKKVGYKS